MDEHSLPRLVSNIRRPGEYPHRIRNCVSRLGWPYYWVLTLMDGDEAKAGL